MGERNRVLIYGAGQIGNMVVSIVELNPGFEVVGFLDDDEQMWGKPFSRWEVFGGNEFLKNPSKPFDSVIVALGRIGPRQRVGVNLRELGIPQPNAIHPSALISKGVVVGEGNIIGAGVNLYVNPIIGNNVFMGPGVVVSHDSVVKDFALLSVGSVIGARVDIDQGAFIGAGATITTPGWGQGERLRVGEHSIVGAGAVVIRNVEPQTIVAGVPARFIRYHEGEM